MSQSDYKKLTPAQLKRLGFSPTSERYLRKGETLAKKNTISRRGFDNLSDRYEVWGGRAAYERRFDVPSWRYFAEEYARTKKLSRQEIRRMLSDPKSPVAREAYRAARAKKAHRYSPRGDLAKFLVKIGKREPDWSFDVGDTPPS